VAHRRSKQGRLAIRRVRPSVPGHQTVDEDERCRVLRIQVRVLQDHWRADAVAHQHDAIGLDVKPHRLNCPCEQVHRELVRPGLVTLAMAW